MHPDRILWQCWLAQCHLILHLRCGWNLLFDVAIAQHQREVRAELDMVLPGKICARTQPPQTPSCITGQMDLDVRAVPLQPTCAMALDNLAHAQQHLLLEADEAPRSAGHRVHL